MPVLTRKSTRKPWIEVFGFDVLAASVDNTVYIARRNCKVNDVRFVTTVSGGASAAVTLKNCTGTQAPSAGTAFTNALDLTSGTTVNTVTAATLTESATYLVAGSRIGADFSGTLTSLVGRVMVTLETY
jgi:hypothetical protein